MTVVLEHPIILSPYEFSELVYDETLSAEAECVLGGGMRIVSANYTLGYIETHVFSTLTAANYWLAYMANNGHPNAQYYLVGADILEGA